MLVSSQFVILSFTKTLCASLIAQETCHSEPERSGGEESRCLVKIEILPSCVGQDDTRCTCSLVATLGAKDLGSICEARFFA